MKNLIQKKYVPMVFAIAIFLSIASIILLIDNLKTLSILKEKPSEIIVANISTTSAQIYWKNNEGINSTLLYKSNDTPLYDIGNNSNLYQNIKGKDFVSEVFLENLEPNTKYSFYIQTPKKNWDYELEFKTKEINEKVSLPEIEHGESNRGSFVLLEGKDGNKMIYTANNDTWALDLKEKEYTVKEYAQYIPSMILKEELESNLFKIASPIYAASGPNCKTNITRNDSQYYPKQDALVDLMETRPSGAILIEGCKGHHATECYNDVYCASIAKGVHPALPLTLWVHESASSMYGKYTPAVEDFGIHRPTDPIIGFSAQLSHLLDVQMADNYIKGYCADKGLTEEQRWATKYAKGHCTDENITGGKSYITTIKTYYSWLKGQNFPAWPWNVPTNSNACDRSKQVTNQVYRNCDGTTTGTNPDPTPTEYTCWYFEPNDTSKKCKSIKSTTSCAIRGMYTSKDSCEKDPLCYIKDGTKCTGTRSTQICDEYHLNSKAFQDNKCTIRWRIENPTPTPPTPDPTPTPTPTPTPDPNVNCSAKDTIPGKDDILVGQTCKDVGGCECFKGSIKVGNYFKDVACGMVCTEEVEEKPKVCCLTDGKLSTTTSDKCNGSIMEDIPVDSCKTTTFQYKLTEGINFIKTYKVFDTNMEQINTAHGLMQYFTNRVTTIASFKNGKWDKIVEFKDGKIYGTDFILNPGETYLILASEELSLSATGYTISPTELDLSKLVGWNLIPTSIFKNKAEKAYSMFGNTNFDPIKQIAIWNKNSSMFEYTVENRDKTVNGDDISLTKQDNIFIRVEK